MNLIVLPIRLSSLKTISWRVTLAILVIYYSWPCKHSTIWNGFTGDKSPVFCHIWFFRPSSPQGSETGITQVGGSSGPRCSFTEFRYRPAATRLIGFQHLFQMMMSQQLLIWVSCILPSLPSNELLEGFVRSILFEEMIRRGTTYKSLFPNQEGLRLGGLENTVNVSKEKAETINLALGEGLKLYKIIIMEDSTPAGRFSSKWMNYETPKSWTSENFTGLLGYALRRMTLVKGSLIWTLHS